jgi:class 3 adenylate cyclase
MTSIPSTLYTKNGEFTLAYQVAGSGRDDLVYLLFETPNVVANWFIPEHVRFLERLASFSRLVITDRRGMGCSDRLAPGTSPVLEDLVDDLLVVMETANAFSATLLAGDETAFIALLAAASHPDRIERLILWEPSPSWHRTDDMPWEDSPDQVEANLGVIRRVTNLRGWAEVSTRNNLPSWAGDPDKVALWEAMSALSGSAEAWHRDQRPFYELDLRDVVATIRTPTLILARTEATMVDIRSVRYLADRMPQATLVELGGADAMPWAGDQDAVLAEIQGFLTGERTPPPRERVLSTVLFTDIVGSTETASELGDRAWADLIARHHEIVRSLLPPYRGREVDTAGDGFLATFDGPARAVECARAITEAVRGLGISVRAGCHAGEVETSGNEVRGIAVHIGARIAAMAGADEVVVSSTVHDLVAGSGLAFDDLGDHDLKGVSDRWHLYRLAGRAEGVDEGGTSP